MTPEDLVGIDKRLAALTPGEWRIIRYPQGGARIFVAGERDGGAEGERRALVADVRTEPEPEPWQGLVAYHEGDREFFFHAPNDVRRLRALVDELLKTFHQARLEQIERAVVSTELDKVLTRIQAPRG